MSSSNIPSRPRKISAFHHKHVALKAKLVENDGGWVLPEYYEDPQAEIARVLGSVGICDISSVRKIDVKGAGIDAFLGRNYPNSAIPRKPGEAMRIEKAAIGNRDSLPIAYVCRLARDQALIIGDDFEESLGSPSVLDVGRRWGGGLNDDGAYLTNVSSVFAGLSLTGPSSPEVLAKLSQLGAFPTVKFGNSITCAQTGLAKIQSLIVQESVRGNQGVNIPSFHLYFGRDYAEYVWDALIDAGTEFGIAPFGVRTMQKNFRQINNGTPDFH